MQHLSAAHMLEQSASDPHAAAPAVFWHANRLETTQAAEVDLVMMQQAAEMSELQAEAVRVAQELDTQQLLALLTQQQLAAQQEQVGS